MDCLIFEVCFSGPWANLSFWVLAVSLWGDDAGWRTLATWQTKRFLRRYGCWTKNRGVKPPQIIHFNRVFHCKPSMLGYHYFWKHPYNEVFSLSNCEMCTNGEGKTSHKTCGLLVCFEPWQHFVWKSCEKLSELYVPGSKLPLCPYNRGWSSTQ